MNPILIASIFLSKPRGGFVTNRLLNLLTKSQWTDRTNIEYIQQQKLAEVLNYARFNVPYYHSYSGWTECPPNELHNRLQQYPILSKDEIRSNPSAMHSIVDSQSCMSKSSTGGTTGQPIEIWRSRYHLAIAAAAYWRGLSWLGIMPWFRNVSIRTVSKSSWYGHLRLTLARTMVIDAFGKQHSDLLPASRRIQRFRPKYVTGYVSDILAIGKACHETGISVDTVLTTGEMLYPHQREEIKRLYGAKVSSYYGCNEVGAMAFECDHGQMHVTDEHVIMEVVNDDGIPVWDEPGRILLTDLDNHLTPFIRYDVGDIGVLTRNSCPCGRNLTVLQEIDGRTQDALVNEFGARLSTLFFAAQFKHLKAIHRMQLVQNSLDHIDLLYEGKSADTDSELNAVINEIRRRLGSQMQVQPRRVETLVYTRRGKYQLVIPLKS